MRRACAHSVRAASAKVQLSPRALRILAAPEAGAFAAAAAVWCVFAATAGSNFASAAGTAAVLNAAAPLGILAVAVTLLMIAGEFDLSIGAIIGAASMTISMLSVTLGWNIWAALLVAAALSSLIGLLNGALVVRTKLPSFIITLATLFIVRGLTIALTRLITGRTQIGGLQDAQGFESARLVFASPIGGDVRIAVLWWCAAVAAGTWLLFRLPGGNWILATGGSAEHARRAGVPVAAVKICLFITTALAAWLVAAIFALRFSGADVLRGEGQEFRAIVACVIGGTLLTGGYGSVVGAALGALVFGMLQQGIVITGVDADWFQVLLGALLIAAVLFNHRVRRAFVERA
jgi:simple sugar transport system permease protein